MIVFFLSFHISIRFIICQLKEVNKEKKITANTVALKTCVPGEGTQEKDRFFFCLQKKEWNYLLA